MKLTPGVRAVTAKPPTRVASVLLHVTPPIVSESSEVRVIRLLAVTAVVFTTTVVASRAITTAPAADDPQTAGDAALAQLVAV